MKAASPFAAAECVRVVGGQDALDMEHHLGLVVTASVSGVVFAGIEPVAVAVHDSVAASYAGPCQRHYREAVCHPLLHHRRLRRHQSRWVLCVRWVHHASQMLGRHLLKEREGVRKLLHIDILRSYRAYLKKSTRKVSCCCQRQKPQHPRNIERKARAPS